MPSPETHTVPADLAELKAGRIILDQWLTHQRLDWSTRVGDMRLVFVELLTNAIEASAPEDNVRYAFASNGCEVVLRFENRNHAKSPVELRSMPEPFATAGRGLALAQDFADRVDIHSLGNEVDITAHFFATDSRDLSGPVP